MKRLIVIFLILTLLFGCKGETSEQDVPPPPPPPGGQATYGITGMATVGIPPWAATAKNIELSANEIFPDKILRMQIYNFERIYKTAYFYNQQTKEWEPLKIIATETIGDWVKGSGVASVPTDDVKFKYGANPIIFYACNKFGSKWSCNSNKWMMVNFILKEKPKGDAPQEKNIEDLVIASNIEPFFLQKTFSEEDNFEDILIMRYDAEYFEPETKLKVKAMVFETKDMADMSKSLDRMFKEIINQGWKEVGKQNIAVYLDVNNIRNAMWTSGKKLIFVETHNPDFANEEIITAYLEKYPSDLRKI